MRGPVEGDRDRGDDGEGVGRRGGAVGCGGGSGSREHHRADDADRDQHVLPARPVGHRREERRQQGRGGHPGGGDGADRRDAAGPEREDAERDHERALARPHHAEGDLRAAQWPAVRRLAERVRPVVQSCRQPRRHGATIAEVRPRRSRSRARSCSSSALNHAVRQAK